MKNILQVIPAVILSTAFIGSVAGAQAPTACNGSIVITNTGPGSANIIECEDVVDINYECDNDVLILNVTTQEGESGTATNTYNTSGGNAITGSVQNDNQTTTDLSTACGPATAPVDEETPGRGGGGAFVPPETVETLPNTNNGSVAPVIVAGVAGIATTFAMSHLAISAYRRLGSN